MLSGEIVTFIETLDFTSKSELLERLRTMRKNTVCLSPKDRQVVKQMIGVAVQQVFHTPENVLLQYAHYKEQRHETK
jgi:hypothetical protein